jgi:hypothetical protein
MEKDFLEQLIKTYPNDYSLGSAIRKYWMIRQEYPNKSIQDIQQKFLELNFQFNL